MLDKHSGMSKRDLSRTGPTVGRQREDSGFSIGNINGVVNDSTNTIQVSFPFGYNRKSLTPTIQVAAGATVSPASGSVVDLTNSAVYTVSNGNIYSKYTVVPSEQPAILSFVVSG